MGPVPVVLPAVGLPRWSPVRCGSSPCRSSRVVLGSPCGRGPVCRGSLSSSVLLCRSQSTLVVVAPVLVGPPCGWASLLVLVRRGSSPRRSSGVVLSPPCGRSPIRRGSLSSSRLPVLVVAPVLVGPPALFSILPGGQGLFIEAHVLVGPPCGWASLVVPIHRGSGPCRSSCLGLPVAVVPIRRSFDPPGSVV